MSDLHCPGVPEFSEVFSGKRWTEREHVWSSSYLEGTMKGDRETAIYSKQWLCHNLPNRAPQTWQSWSHAWAGIQRVVQSLINDHCRLMLTALKTRVAAVDRSGTPLAAMLLQKWAPQLSSSLLSRCFYFLLGSIHCANVSNCQI